MNYPPDAFAALQEEIERQGGALLPEPHMPMDIVHRKQDGYKKNKVWRRETSGCKKEARFVVVYDSGEIPPENGAGFARVCAVDDNVGAWPRFCNAVYEVDPELNPSYRDEDEEDEEDNEDEEEDDD